LVSVKSVVDDGFAFASLAAMKTNGMWPDGISSRDPAREGDGALPSNLCGAWMFWIPS
jgi:hypothetical protein